VPAFHGRGSAGEPEWPPSPLRLFQALLAAAASRWRESQFDEYARPALEWLQHQDPPVIVAPGHHIALPFRLPVPNNDLDVTALAWAKRQKPRKQPSELKTMKNVTPTLMMNGDVIHYLWPLDDADRDFAKYRATLSQAAHCVTHLGWGVDMVAADVHEIPAGEADHLKGERWLPVEDSSATGYRVPVPETLDSLIQRHQAFLNRLGLDGFRPVSPLSAFRVVGYRRASDLGARPYVAFKLLHPVLERLAWFSATRANCVAAMARHAMATAANQQPSDWVNSYVHGHRSNGEEMKPRFSYLPLPTIEHRGDSGTVVGGIRRLLVTELMESSRTYLPWVKKMLPGQFLIDEKTGDRTAMLAPLSESDWVLQRYTASADTWATATPVVLPGSDDGKFAKAEKLFLKALGHAGYCVKSLAELEFRNVSFLPGSDLALRFQRADYLRKDYWSVYHVRIRWKQSIRGPLAIGAGRHCGLGIFAIWKG
jgi:CRISPR-associated protein Csb2